MSHDKIKAATRRRMARTGEPYATARRQVLADQSNRPGLSAADVRAAAAAHEELGPEYSDTVVASFLAKVDEEIAARVDARLAQSARYEAPAGQGSRRNLLRGIAIGIVISAVALIAVGGNAAERTHRLLVVLVVLAAATAAGEAIAGRPQANRRGARPEPPGVPATPGSDQR